MHPCTPKGGKEATRWRSIQIISSLSIGFPNYKMDLNCLQGSEHWHMEDTL